MSSLMRFMPLSSALVVGLVGATGCPEPAQCRVDDDCSFGEQCLAESCFPLPGSTGGGPRPIGGGGGAVGGGNNNNNNNNNEPIFKDPRSPVNVPGPLSAFRDDDLGVLGVVNGQPAGSYEVGIYGANDDKILFFDPDPAADTLAQNVSAGKGIDFAAGDIVNAAPDANNRRCGFDHASVQAGYQPPPDAGDELWIACQRQPRLLQVRASRVDQQLVAAAGKGADFVLALGADVDDTQVLQRRVYAARGDSALYIERNQQQDNVELPRQLDKIVGVEFGAIGGLFLLHEDIEIDGRRDSFGDVIAVFDRASPRAEGKAALVVLERGGINGPSDEWHIFQPAGFDHVLVLPDETHTILLGPVPDPQTLVVDNVQQQEVNLVVFRPTAARIEYGRYELAMGQANFSPFTLASSGGFDPLLLDRAGATAEELPPPGDRTLLIPAGDDAVIYVMTNKLVGWRIPLRRTSGNSDDRQSDLRVADFGDAFLDGQAIGLLPSGGGEDRAAWIAVTRGPTSTTDQLVHIPFRL